MPSARPRIGLIADHRAVTVGAWQNVEAAVVPAHYLAAVSQAGGLPLVLPVDPALLEDPLAGLESLDALVLIGGRDLQPAMYGAAAHPANDPTDALATPRDELELALVRTALELDLPLLGICRGMQLLNVALGGDLEQHLADRLDLTSHRDRLGQFTTHDARAVAGTRLASILGRGPLPVASHHHQGVDRAGDGLVPAAFAPDGVLEALELPGASFCVAVLWHPEEDLEGTGLTLFQALVRSARTYQEARVAIA